VRAYARELLDADGLSSEVHLRHCQHFVAFAERAIPHLRTHAEEEWMRRLDAETDNFRAALGWALGESQPTLAIRLAGWLGEYWELRSASAEGVRWVETAIEAAGDEVPVGDRARALRARVLMLEEQGAWFDVGGSRAAGMTAASEAVAVSRRAGDPAGLAEALLHLSTFVQSEPEHMRALAEEALAYARQAEAGGVVAHALAIRTLSFRIVEVEAEIAQAAALLREVGDIHSLAGLYNDAAYLAIGQGSYERANAYLDEALPLAEGSGEPLRVIIAFENLGLVALFMADLERAAAHFGRSLRLCVEHGVAWIAAGGIGGLAAIAARRGETERAARLLGAAESLANFLLADATGVRLEEEFFSLARERLGVKRWRAAYADGARLGFDEAVSLALGDG
jgi:tetratricopeptide (TPR) repeat protein